MVDEGRMDATTKEINTLLQDGPPLPTTDLLVIREQREIAEAQQVQRDWEPIPKDIDSTPEQRRPLYQFGLPKTLVRALDREQAAKLLALLVEFRQQGLTW